MRGAGIGWGLLERSLETSGQFAIRIAVVMVFALAALLVVLAAVPANAAKDQGKLTPIVVSPVPQKKIVPAGADEKQVTRDGGVNSAANPAQKRAAGEPGKVQFGE